MWLYLQLEILWGCSHSQLPLVALNFTLSLQLENPLCAYNCESGVNKSAVLRESDSDMHWNRPGQRFPYHWLWEMSRCLAHDHLCLLYIHRFYNIPWEYACCSTLWYVLGPEDEHGRSRPQSTLPALWWQRALCVIRSQRKYGWRMEGQMERKFSSHSGILYRWVFELCQGTKLCSTERLK